MSYRYSHLTPRGDSGRYLEGWAYEYPRAPRPKAAAPAPRPAQAQTHSRPRSKADYTLAYAGHHVRLGPVAFWIVVGSLVVMATWSIGTGTYFAFHDDVLKRLISRQTDMQFAYEDRIAELRAQVDRITSRQLLDQEQFEQKLEHVFNRQATLESRAATLSGLPDVTGSIKGRGNAGSEPSRPTLLKPSPISDTIIFTAPPDREARLESRALPIEESRTAGKSLKGGIEGALARLQQSMDRVEAQQTSALNMLEGSFDGKTKRILGVLADLGVDAGKAPATLAAGATGGPFVPVQLRANSSSFERQIYRINLARAQVDRLTRTLAAVPVRKPIFGEIDMSSPFGMRMDPFVKGPAIHTGIDMRGDTGDPVRATAAGTVEVAGWNGGYGKMVEIDHGNGFSTRYGHLSEVEVKAGQTVRTGQVIGKIGSTGRSTGPHLHYETRVDGDAVDPQKFLRAGIRLGSNL